MMTIVEYLPPALEGSAADYAQKIIEEIDFLCVYLWRKSTPQIRNRYLNFKRPQQEFRLGKQQRTMFPENYATLAEARVVLQKLVGFEDLESADDDSDRDSMGVLLEFASLASCMLGMKASYGDVVTHLMDVQDTDLYTIHRKYHEDPYTAFVEGNMKPALHFFCLGLRRGALNLQVKGLTSSPVLYYDRKTDLYMPDMQVVATRYHFYRSLLQFFSGTVSLS